MNPLTPKQVLVFDWYAVIRAFEEHTGMSFNSHGCWGLDYTKICGEPDFRYHSILRHEQDYLYHSSGNTKEYCQGDLKKVLKVSEKGDYQGKEYYRIPFHLVIDYLIFHNILPEDYFLITNLIIS